jgi:hypothetical protein
MLIVSASERRQLGRHHGALRLIEVSTAKVEADDIGNGIVARVVRERRFYARRFAGPKPIAAVENLVLKDDNRLVQSMLADIGHEFIKLSALDQREYVSELVKLERCHCRHRGSRSNTSGDEGDAKSSTLLFRMVMRRSPVCACRWNATSMPILRSGGAARRSFWLNRGHSSARTAHGQGPRGSGG